MVPSHLSCRICDRGRFGGRLFRLPLLTVCCLARRDPPPRCLFLPETHVNGFCATYSGISGLSEAFLEGVFYFCLGFKALEVCSAMPSIFIPKTTLTLTFVKLVVRECRAPLKSLAGHARLWTIHGYPDVSKNFLIPSQPSPISGRGLLLNSKQFSDFLVSLSPPKYISSCTSDGVIKFLISKDSSGRTVVHSQLCPKASCNCPFGCGDGRFFVPET